MADIHFIEPDGTERVVAAGEGVTLLRLALDNDVAGILGDCGGNCACATCHIYVEGAAAACLLPPSEDEQMMLDGALHQHENSRLACQISVSAKLDGLIARMPPSQV